MSWAAALVPLFRARASPNLRRSWRTTLTSSGVEGRHFNGGSDPSSTMITSNNSRG